MLLTDEQKHVFESWLQQEISSSEGIQQQFVKVLSGPVLDALTRKYQTERAACQIVLRMITSGETMSISTPRGESDGEAKDPGP